jgi:CRISPR-associated protein Csm1
MTNPENSENSTQIALQVIQQGVITLAKWSKCEHPKLDNEYPAVNKAKKILGWNETTEISSLGLLFDHVKLEKNQPTQKHYHPLTAIENEDQKYPKIPYPLNNEPTQDEITKFQTTIKKEISSLLTDNWENQSLLMLILEKYGSCLSFGEKNVALIDMVKATAGLASTLVNNPEAENISLIVGDLSGIQKFIYTISSDGALKSLRARSFYLELVTEEVVQQLLEKLQLPRTNVIYAGGGNLYILAAATENTKNITTEIREQFNHWLLGEFQGKVFLALDVCEFPTNDLKTDKFAQHWSNATKKLAVHKAQKFATKISDFIQPRYSHEPCRVCYRDDVEPGKLKPLNKEEPDSVLSCDTCRSMFELGGELFKVNAIVRSKQPEISNALYTLSFPNDIKYHLFANWKQIDPLAETVLLVNDWNLEHYQFKHFKNVAPLLLGNYGKKDQNEKGFLRAEEMAAISQGIKRVASLRMDVDKLGQIFAKGLKENQTLPRLAGLSRQMSYFFKVYLNSLADQNSENIPKNIKQILPKEEQYNILFIYAGGDDLFVSGAWDEIVNFAFDVYQSFRYYTGNNPDITLSGGVSIDTPKFPLYQAAKSSGDAEEEAKGNGRDSLGLFGEVFKWDEWLGTLEKTKTEFETINNNYSNPEPKPNLIGIIPFVEILQQENIGVNYSRNFVRNLLITAEMQERALKKFQDQKTEEALQTRYYLHLPKIAYTLARLPNKVLENDDFRTSLKSPYNAPYFRAIATWIELLNRGS